jgi:hypothetical protein
MRVFSVARNALPVSALVIALGLTSVLSAQSFEFTVTANFPQVPVFSYTSPYVQCVAPAIQTQENSLVQLFTTYGQQKVILVQQRGQARIQAWAIPEASARSRALRDIERAYRDSLRELNRWLRDQEKAIKRQFKDAEDVCDDQFDTDVNSPEENFSSSSSSFSSFNFSSASSGFVSCNGNDVCLPQATCNANGGIIKSPGLCGDQSQMNAGYACCQLPGASSAFSTFSFASSSRSSSSSSRSSSFSSSRSSSSRSSSSFNLSSVTFQPNEQQAAQQNMESCGCQTVCDPSGSPCMAVCPSEC